MKIFVAILCAFLGFMTGAVAAEPPKVHPETITHDGIAFSLKIGEKDPVVAYDVVDAWRGKITIADCTKWSAFANGATWCFASARNQVKFVTKTDKEGGNAYAPHLGGRCVLGTSWGYPAARGDPRTAKVYRTELGDVLILQSAAKWVPVFDQDPQVNRKIARAVFNFGLASGIITPNRKR
ncbi:MAG: hypothetical protein AAB421_01540 [Patescibacteria group bacterium]